MGQTQEEILGYYDQYYDMIWRICLMQMGKEEDAYDAVQETFLRLIRKGKVFRDTEHAKAWLIQTAVNYCRDVHKSAWRQHYAGDEGLELLNTETYSERDREVFETLMELPKEQRVILYLYFYEGYSLKEIAGLLKVNASTLRSRFAKAKERMREYLEEDSYEADTQELSF